MLMHRAIGPNWMMDSPIRTSTQPCAQPTDADRQVEQSLLGPSGALWLATPCLEVVVRSAATNAAYVAASTDRDQVGVPVVN